MLVGVGGRRLVSLGCFFFLVGMGGGEVGVVDVDGKVHGVGRANE